MQTGNKPTPAMQYPGPRLADHAADAAATGRAAVRLLRRDRATATRPATSARPTTRSSSRATAAKRARAAKANFRVRGIQLPTGFTLDELEDRDKLLNDFDGAFRASDKAGDLVDGLDAFHKKALEILRSDKTKKAFDLTQEKQELRDRLRRKRFRPRGVGGAAAGRGRRALCDDQHGRLGHARQKLRGAVEATAAAAGSNAFDADSGPDATAACWSGRSSTAPANSAGRRRSTRTPAATIGRGRWRCCWPAAAFKRGYAHGTTDAQGMAPATEPCTPDDVSSTIFHCLGIDPHTEMQTSTGRPIQLFREGRVIDKLLA